MWLVDRTPPSSDVLSVLGLTCKDFFGSRMTDPQRWFRQVGRRHNGLLPVANRRTPSVTNVGRGPRTHHNNMEAFPKAESDTTLGPDGNIHDHSPTSCASIIIATYLVENVTEFRDLAELRKQVSARPY